MPGFETLCAHAGEDPRRHCGAVTPPIYQSSLFTSPDCEAFAARHERWPEVYDYTRVANPTTDVLEAKLAALEQAEACRVFGSGMAAVSAAILHCVRAGDHVVAVDSVYGPTRALLTGYLKGLGIETTWVRGEDPEEFARAARKGTRLFYLESPSSVVMRLQDLEAVAEVARERGVATVVDNSWASPYYQNPLALGIDLVVHSATKYLGGHSDIVAGAVMGSAERIQQIASREGVLLGAVLDPFASWLMIRGVRTLALRMERHQQSGLAVARFLEQHPKVARVHYAGLESHPQRALAVRQMRGSSGLLSLELKDGTREAAFRFVDSLRWFAIGVSWGGYESLALPVGFVPEGKIPGRAPFVFPGITPPAQEVRWGVRLHVGLETVDDLLEDLSQALDQIP